MSTDVLLEIKCINKQYHVIKNGVCDSVYKTKRKAEYRLEELAGADMLSYEYDEEHEHELTLIHGIATW